MALDLIIAGGRVIDAAASLDAILDVGVSGGKIVAIAPKIDRKDAKEIYDASGQIVCAGLVDMHAHVYRHATPLGIDVDHYCLGRGVTTVVDAGSAGATTFMGLKKFIIEKSKTRVLAFLNMALHGLASAGCTGGGTGGELDSINQVSVVHAVSCVNKHRGTIVGLKLRLSGDCANNFANEPEAYRRALQASKQASVPLMTHHTFSSIPLANDGAGEAPWRDVSATSHDASDTDDAPPAKKKRGEGDRVLGCPDALRKGDIYTHMLHGFPSTIIATADSYVGKVHPVVVSARKRGVIFDVGHGQGSFSWSVAELCAQFKFWPDVISTDLHSGGCEGPTYDLPTVMTRFLAVGMPLPQVIAACTLAPAEAIKWSDRIGVLAVGREADITVIDLKSVDVQLEDCQNQLRDIKTRVVAAAVWRAGVRQPLTQPKRWPNPNSESSALVCKLVVDDSKVISWRRMWKCC